MTSSIKSLYSFQISSSCVAWTAAIAAAQLQLPELLEYERSESLRGKAKNSALVWMSILVRFVERLGGSVLTLLFCSPDNPSDRVLVLETG
jgi:hypothetical protein